MGADRRLTFLRLTRLQGAGPVLLKRLLDALGSAEAVLEAHPSVLAGVEGIGLIKANQIVTSAPATREPAEKELAAIEQHGFRLLTYGEPEYPPGLRNVADPPIVLYVRGELQPADAVAIGMVGARRCTLYGREQAQRLGAQLAEAGLTIVSGGARGIDTCAHLGALQVGGRTVVVTGCGLLNTYPPENDGLYDRVVNEGRGAIISELPLDAPPAAENFPPRNRIIAGMTLGIVVVEANLKSGSLITARLAAGDYGREVFALPGRVDSPSSAGTHHLIKTASAHLVENAEDILQHLGDVGGLLAKYQRAAQKTDAEALELFEHAVDPPKPPEAPLTEGQQRILAAINAAGKSLDEIVDATELPPQVIMAELTLLQIRGKVRRLRENRFARQE